MSKSEQTNDVTLVFKENRPYELYVGRSCFMFDALGVQKVPAWVTKHADFKKVSDKFVIKGAK